MDRYQYYYFAILIILFYFNTKATIKEEEKESLKDKKERLVKELNNWSYQNLTVL